MQAPIPVAKPLAGRRWRGLAEAAAVTALLLVLLSSAIRNRSIYYDEAITLIQLTGNGRPQWPERSVPVETVKPVFTQAAAPWQMTRDVLLEDNHPPFYYWMLLLWRGLFGPSLEALRWLSALCVIAQALLILRFATHLKRPFLAALLFTVCAFTIASGALARDYAMASLFILTAMLAAARKPALPSSIATAVGASLAIATHYLAFLPIGVVLQAILVRYRKQRLKADLIPILSILATSLLIAPFPLRRLLYTRAFLRGFQGLAAESRALVWGFYSGFAPEPGALSTWLGRAAALLIALCLGAGLWRSLRRFGTDLRVALPAAICVLQICGYFFIALAGNKTLIANQTPRYLALVLPATVMLLVYGAELLPGWSGSAALAALIVLQIPQVRYGQDLRGETGRHMARILPPGSNVVIGAGYGRGIPAIMMYELKSVNVCVLLTENSCADTTRDAVFIRPQNIVARKTEDAFLQKCENCRVYLVNDNNFP